MVWAVPCVRGPPWTSSMALAGPSPAEKERWSESIRPLPAAPTCATHGAWTQQCTEGKVHGVGVHHVWPWSPRLASLRCEPALVPHITSQSVLVLSLLAFDVFQPL